MEKIMKQMERNIKQQEKALRASERLISKQVKENAKLEKANNKLIQQANNRKFKDISKMFTKTQRSFKMKFMHQNKKIAKMLALIKTTQQQIEAKSDVALDIKFYSRKVIERRTYRDIDVRYDSDRNKYVFGLQLHGVRIKSSKVQEYELHRFYNMEDDTVQLVRDFVSLIKSTGETEKIKLKISSNRQILRDSLLFIVKSFMQIFQ